MDESVANGHLASWGVAGRIGEDVLGRWDEVLARTLRGRGVPDLNREHAIAHRIQRLDGAHTHRPWTRAKGLYALTRLVLPL